MSARAFLSRNAVVVVMLPLIIGAHYGWYKLQKVDVLVSEEDRKRLPFSSLLFGHWRPSIPEFLTRVASEDQFFKYTDEEYMLTFC